jgi:hypothetical protein
LKTLVERGIETEDATFLIDNCPSHLTSDIVDFLNTAKVRVITFAAHTTQILQRLRLILFGIFKREGKGHLPFGNLETRVDFVYKVYTKTAKTLTLSNI